MKFGVLFLPSGWKGTSDVEIYHQLVDQAQAAEELGFDEVWLTEHHFSQYGRPGISPLAAAIAMRTQRIRIGTTVYVPLIHHPLDIAEDAAVIDILSRGRLDFGVGRGYQPDELLAYGVDPATSRERHNEAIEIIKRAWLHGEIEYEGQFWKIPRREFRPLPFQKPHPPIWQPIISPESFEEAVRLGKNAIFGVYLRPLRLVANSYRTWHETLERLGADQTSFHDMCSVMIHVAETEAEARAASEEAFMWLAPTFARLIGADRADLRERFEKITYDEIAADCALVGTPDRVAEGIEWFRSIGCSHVACLMNFGDIDHRAVLRSMELFARHVAPLFRNADVQDPNKVRVGPTAAAS